MKTITIAVLALVPFVASADEIPADLAKRLCDTYRTFEAQVSEYQRLVLGNRNLPDLPSCNRSGLRLKNCEESNAILLQSEAEMEHMLQEYLKQLDRLKDTKAYCVALAQGD